MVQSQERPIRELQFGALALARLHTIASINRPVALDLFSVARLTAYACALVCVAQARKSGCGLIR